MIFSLKPDQEFISENDLKEALDKFVNFPELMGKVMQTIGKYVLYDMAVNEGKDEFTDKEFFIAVSKLTIEFTLEQLYNDGYVDIDFEEQETKYVLNEKGKAFQEKIIEKTDNLNLNFKYTYLLDLKK